MLEQWVLDILADPITKLPASPDDIGVTNGVVDARRLMKNTIGFKLWDEGQVFYESWERKTVEDYSDRNPRSLRAKLATADLRVPAQVFLPIRHDLFYVLAPPWITNALAPTATETRYTPALPRAQGQSKSKPSLGVRIDRQSAQPRI